MLNLGYIFHGMIRYLKFFIEIDFMRYLTLLASLSLATSVYAMLPTPTQTNVINYTAVPTNSPNTPTLNQTSTPHQVPTQITSVINAFVVKTDNLGQETLVPVNVGTPVKSGDILEYQGLFTNQGADRVRKADVTLSITDELELVGGISPQFALASSDGSRFTGMPIRAKIGGQIQELPLSRYKALRWTIEDLGIGGTAVVKYRAKVK